MKRLLLAVAILSLVSCGGSATVATTPAPPNSPQTLVLNIDKTLADSINAAVKTAITLRDQGKLDQSNVVLIENWAKSAAMLDDRIATELASADTWAVQKAKILAMLPGFRVPIVSGLNPTVQAALATVQTIILQLQSQVGL